MNLLKPGPASTPYGRTSRSADCLEVWLAVCGPQPSKASLNTENLACEAHQVLDVAHIARASEENSAPALDQLQKPLPRALRPPSFHDEGRRPLAVVTDKIPLE